MFALLQLVAFILDVSGSHPPEALVLAWLLVGWLVGCQLAQKLPAPSSAPEAQTSLAGAANLCASRPVASTASSHLIQCASRHFCNHAPIPVQHPLKYFYKIQSTQRQSLRIDTTVPMLPKAAQSNSCNVSPSLLTPLSSAEGEICCS